MPRYFDGIDLMSMSLVIHYLNSQGQENHSNPINVSYNDEKIRFHWLIDENVTCISGEITFEIIAYGKNEKARKICLEIKTKWDIEGQQVLVW